MVNFPTRIPGCHSHSPALLDLFVSFDTSICSTVTFPPLGNPDNILVSNDFPSNSKRDALFYHIAYDCSHADYDHLRGLSKMSLNLMILLLLVNLVLG